MPSTADVYVRLRVDPAQVKKDTEAGLSGIDGKESGSKVGKEFGDEFDKTVQPAVQNSGKKAGQNFGQKLSEGFSIKRAAIGTAITAALAVGPAAIGVAGAAIGVGVAAAAGAAIFASLSKSLKTANTAVTTTAKASLAAANQLTSAQKSQALAVIALNNAEKTGNVSQIAAAKVRLDAANKALAVAKQGVTTSDQAAKSAKQAAAEAAKQIAPYNDVKAALTNVKATLIDVGSKALVNSGILKAMTNAVTQFGTWLTSHQATFTAFFAAAAPYVPIFVTFIENLVGTLLPEFASLMDKARAPVQGVLTALLGFVKSGIGSFLSAMGNNAGTSAKAFGVLLAQIQPLLPLLGGLSGIAAKLVVAFPALVPLILGVALGLKAILVVSSVAAGVGKLTAAFTALKEMCILTRIQLLLMEAQTIAVKVAQLAVAAASKVWAAAQWLLNAALDGNPIGLLIIALVGLVAAVILVVKNWGPISGFFIDIWNHIYSGFITPIVNFFTQTVPHAFGVTVSWLKSNWPLLIGIVLGPVAEIVGVIIKYHAQIFSVIQTAWNNIKTFFGQVLTAIEVVFNAYIAIYKAIFTAVWNAISATAQAVWNALKAFFTGWWNANVALATTEINAIRSVLTTVWNAISSTAQAIWNTLKAAWQNFWNGLVSVSTGAYQKIQSGLNTFFGWLKTGFQGAVNAVQTIWAKIQDITAAPVRFVVNTVYNKGIVPVVDAIAGVVGLHPLNAISGFASGTGGAPPGWAWVGEQGPELAYFHGGEQVLSNPQSMAAVGAGAVPGFASGTSPVEARVGPGADIQGGSPIPGGGVLKNIGSGISSVVSAGVNALRTLAGDALAAGINAIVNPLISQIPGLNTGFGSYIKQDVSKVEADMVNWIKGKSAAISSPVKNVGSGTARWKGLVDQALKLLGLSTSLDANVLYQMQTESGGNPNAINLTDSNAQAGDPSRGLMQVIMSTFQAYHVAGTSSNIYDPLANIAAAINYGRARYGPTLESGGQGIGSGHGYRNGGLIAENVYGFGASSGDRYKFDAGENVQSREAAMASADKLDTLIGLMRDQNRINAAIPAGVGRHLGSAMAGQSSDAVFRSRYPTGGF